MNNEGNTHASRSLNLTSSYIPNDINNNHGAGTYTSSHTEPTVQDFENIFGPAARQIKDDLQRYKRHGRWHLPDILKGPNPWLADRIDGLITDATSSPFTSTILPYRYYDNVDGKIKWNVWSFDEAMASRVPYEAAARTLTQTKRSFAAYGVRHGLAITMEHNFMMTPKGRENFQNQLNQLVGSIQYSNDLDVHMALILAPSYEKHMLEKYNNFNKSPTQSIREYVDLFGFMQKNQNALDILIEEAKRKLKLWGGPMPNFMLTNSKLTFQLTMTPERTNYITQGIDGVKRLRQGPDLSSYRGVSIIPSRSFSMEAGQPPRDVMRRRVRVAEYYRITPDTGNHEKAWELYNEDRDTFFTLTFLDLLKMGYFSEMRQYRYNNDGRPRPIGEELGGNFGGTLGGDFGETLGCDDDDLGDHFLGVGPGQKNRPKTPASMGPSNYFRMISFIMRLSIHFWSNGGFQGRYQDDLYNFMKDFAKKESSVANMEELENPDRWQSYVDEIFQDKNHPFGKALKNWGDLLKNKKRNDAFKSDIDQDPSSTSPTAQPAISTEVLSEWNDLLHEVDHSVSSDVTVLIPPEKLLASFTGDSSVFVPFLGNLHFTTQNIKSDLKQSLRRVPPGITQLLANSQAPYPRKFTTTRTAHSLCNPCTFEKHSLGTPEYLETSILLHRLFQRYASPTSFLQVQENSIHFNPECLARNHLHVGDMFLQPLGAILEPNHPLHHENLPLGLTKEVAESWILTEEVLDLLYHHPERHHLACQIAAGISGSNLSKAEYSVKVNEQIELAFAGNNWTSPKGVASSLHVYTYTPQDSYLLSQEYINPKSPLGAKFHSKLKQFAPRGVLTNKYLHSLTLLENNQDHPWMQPATATKGKANPSSLAKHLAVRLHSDAYAPYKNDLADSIGAHRLQEQILTHLSNNVQLDVAHHQNHPDFTEHSLGIPQLGFLDIIRSPPANALPRVVNGFERNVATIMQDIKNLVSPKNWEFIIIRPNIEHYMLGIILGQSGDSLGNTLWGQTELSVYDDAQHGVWGMSYKYHERAIVFNEKNLIRLWDIAYDGYNGGKDDTFVNWDSPEDIDKWKEDCNDVTRDYHGKSMVVMAMFHMKSPQHEQVYTERFRQNWPSPIVWYRRQGKNTTGTSGAENENVVSLKEFEVFDPILYPHYAWYEQHFTHFADLYATRKSAPLATQEDETQVDCLAFQGTMRVKTGAAGMQADIINGSGHHGPDYIGVASVRAGKGYKMMGGISGLIRQV